MHQDRPDQWGTIDGPEVFTETHVGTTNEYGLINLVIRSVNTEDFSTIDWSSGPFFLKVNVNGTPMGVTQLLSVPYAIYAEKSGDAFSGDYNDLINNPTNVSHFNNDVGYISEFTESDPVFIAHPSYDISSSDITNWNTAYNWGIEDFYKEE